MNLRFVSGMVRHINTGGNPTVASCISKFPPSSGVARPEAVTWDGKSNGTTVRSGVYLYQLKSEGTTVTGTVVFGSPVTTAL